MEFNDLLTQAAHEEGAECNIIDPSTAKPTDFFIKVLGVDSLEFQKAQRKLRNQAVQAYSDKKAITEEQEIESEIKHLVSVTIGWRGLESEGKEKKFSSESCKELYTKSPGLRSQVDRFVSDRTNFTKG